MRVHNIRLGFATNSSSSHSIVFWPEDLPIPPTDEFHQFGWENFTVSDREGKRNYLAYQLFESIRSKFTKNHTYGTPEYTEAEGKAVQVLEETFPGFKYEGGYVDHQSVLALPVGFDDRGEFDMDLLRALAAYFSNPRVVVLGGNDNGSPPKIPKGAKPFNFPGLESGPRAIARNDGTHWVLFQEGTGAKIRFSLENFDEEITKAKTPELVDIKITDYCPFGCTYCYQASTLQGQHAPLERIQQIAQVLRAQQVFEVAIGGGEPTLHPDFYAILQTFRKAGIVPNFTTRNLAWLKDERREQYLKEIGSYAFSADKREDVQRLVEALGERPKYGTSGINAYDKTHVQYVVGSGGDLYGVLDEAADHGLRSTLLGFKETGFGAEYKQRQEDWISVVKALTVADKVVQRRRRLRIGVDTAIVKRGFKRMQQELNINELLMTKEEGKFSMYIDAVANKIGPSSYCSDSEYQPLPLLADGSPDAAMLGAAFNQW